MENYSLSNAFIDILKESKDTNEASERLTSEILANAIFICGKISFNEIKHFYMKNVIEPREDIKKLIIQNEVHNSLLARQVDNQDKLIKALKSKGII